MKQSLSKQFKEFIKSNPQVSADIKAEAKSIHTSELNKVAKATGDCQEQKPITVTIKPQPQEANINKKPIVVPKVWTEDERREFQRKTMEEFDKLFGTKTIL